jgi:hypothetical protein
VHIDTDVFVWVKQIVFNIITVSVKVETKTVNRIKGEAASYTGVDIFISVTVLSERHSR